MGDIGFAQFIFYSTGSFSTQTSASFSPSPRTIPDITGTAMSFIVLRSGATHDLVGLLMAKGPAASIYKGLLYNSIINKNAQWHCIATTYWRLFSVPRQARPPRI